MAFLYKNNPLKDGTYTITSTFGYRKPMDTSKGTTSSEHKGIDLGTYGGAAEAILAVADGTVSTVAYQDGGYGHYIIIKHTDGVETRYAHMNSRSHLSAGDIVTAGDLLGYVGSSGASTGPHLHFEIRINGTPIDPQPYITAGGSSIVSPDYTGSSSNSSSTDSIESMYTVDASSGLFMARRVSDVTPQPLHAFVNIYIGDNLVLLSTEPPKPNILQSFEYNRMQDAGESASFTVFDDNWEEIEWVLSQNFDHIYIEYGYYGTGLKSKKIKHRLLNYSISFVNTGAILSVSSVTEGAYENLSPRSLTLGTYNPTEAVKKICESLGYDTTTHPEYFDSSADVVADNPFNMIEDYPLTYIHDTIIPQASQEGEELFTFYIDEEGYPHFERESYDADSALITDMKTYIYQKGYDSPVIDLSFDIKGVFGGRGDFEITTGYKSSVFDTKTKSPSSHKATKSSVVTVATGDMTHTNSYQSVPSVDAAGYSAAQMKSKLYYNMKAMRYDAYGATMTIVGDPTVKLNDYIRIINVTDAGYLHHTSGVYRINDVIDSIQGGEMVTTMKLVRNATFSVEGIELLNPKWLVR